MSLNGVFRGLSDELKKDIEERSNGNGSHFGWFKLKGHGSEAIVRFLIRDENDPNVVAVYEHSLGKRNRPPYNVTCIGKENGCPFCEAGERASLKVYFLVWNYNATPDADGTTRHIQVWKRGTTDIQNILGLKEEYGDLNNRDYKIKRNGTTMQNTSYQFFAKDKTDFTEVNSDELNTVVDAIIKMVSPKSVQELRDIMNGVEPAKEEVKAVEPPADFDPDLPF